MRKVGKRSMMNFEKSKWIWCENPAQADSYGEFYTSLT